MTIKESDVIKNDIRAICCDVDGTLVRDDKSLSDENCEWIHKAVHQAGIPFTVVSGRPLNGILPFYQKIGITGPVSCFNGGTLVDENGNIVDDHRMSYDLALSICNIHDKYPNLDMIIFNGMKWYLETKDCYSYEKKKRVYNSECLLGNLRSLLTEFDTNKIIFMGPSSSSLDAIMDEIGKTVGVENVTLYRNLDFLEVMPSGYDKSTSVDSLAKLLKIDVSQIMAIGDDYNDIAMLQKAGYPVAMANSVPEVKAIAKYVTDTNNNDGVAKAIQKLIFNL